MLYLIALLVNLLATKSLAYENIYGEPLQPCSQTGMALTGWTRSGSCVDYNDDGGSHHICIDLSSTTTEENFCEVTGQSNWCESEMECDGVDGNCPVENWCVCQWAFSSYISNAGGCDYIQDIVCDAINMEAYIAYDSSTDPNHKVALECIQERCGSVSSTTVDNANTDVTDAIDSTDGTTGATTPDAVTDATISTDSTTATDVITTPQSTTTEAEGSDPNIVADPTQSGAESTAEAAEAVDETNLGVAPAPSDSSSSSGDTTAILIAGIAGGTILLAGVGVYISQKRGWSQKKLSVQSYTETHKDTEESTSDMQLDTADGINC